MQSRERQVTRLSDPQCRFDGLEVAHLADQYYVGILTQGGAEGLRETFCISVDLALINDTVLVIMKKLDWVLDRQNVLVALFIDLVDHRRQRC